MALTNYNPYAPTTQQMVQDPALAGSRMRPMSPTMTSTDRGGAYTMPTPGYVPAGLYGSRSGAQTASQWQPTAGMTKEQWQASQPTGPAYRSSGQSGMDRGGLTGAINSDQYFNSQQEASDWGAYQGYGTQQGFNAREDDWLMDAAGYLPYVAMAGMGGLAALGAAPAAAGSFAGGTSAGGLAGGVSAGQLAAAGGMAGTAGAGLAGGTAGTLAGIGGGAATGSTVGGLGLAAGSYAPAAAGAGYAPAAVSGAKGGMGTFLKGLLGSGATGAAGTAGTVANSALGWGDVAGGLLQGGLDLYSSNQQNASAERAAAMNDPFASQRGQYQQQLAGLMRDPSSINQDPSYQFRLKSGQQALERSNAAQGYLNSGNILSELQNYGQESASQELGNQRQLLSQLAGANFGTGGAGNAYMEGQQGSLAQQYQGLSQLGSLGGRALTNLFGSNNSQPDLVE